MRWLPVVLLLTIGDLACGQNPAPPVAPPAPSQPATRLWLDTLDAQWQPLFTREVTSRFDSEAAQLAQQYLATLDANIAAAATAGNLDLTVLWRKEREHFLSAKDVPPTDAAGDPAALKSARATFRTQAARTATERATRARALHARYDQLLAQAQMQLTQQQRIEDALAVKTRREEIARAWLGEAEAANLAKAEKAGAAATPFASALPTPAAISADGREALFVGKTWVSPAGTEYTFEPKGAGHTQADPIKWRHLGGGIVEVTLPGKSKDNTRYFKFISATVAYYNGDRKDITKPVHLK
jgi:hypothetical protein